MTSPAGPNADPVLPPGRLPRRHTPSDHPTRQTWATGTDYAEGDVVVVYDLVFVCLVPHRSKVFGNDFHDERRWVCRAP